jgi:acetyl-CoA carboxylase carboxyltransferase component
VPVIGAVLGSSAGGPAARAVLSHFSVMVEGTSHVFSAGPAVVERALGERPTKDDLGGADVAVNAGGAIHNRVATEDEAFDQVRRVLGYLPSNAWELPPRTSPDDPADRRDEALLAIVPRNRRRLYDMRRLLGHVVDRDSLFEIRPTYGRTVITALARLDGFVVGVVASNPMHLGGALDAPGARKMEHFVEVCDTFHVPLVFFVDTPGFMIGRAAELAGTLPAGARALWAAQRATVWPSAEWGSLPIEGGVAVAYRREIAAAADPARRQRELEDELRALNSPWRTAEAFGVEDIVDPRETRPLLCRLIEAAQGALRGGLGPRARAGVRP